jgi:hypothetical protein
MTSESPIGLDLDNPGQRGRKDMWVMVLPNGFPWYPEHIPEELKAGRVWVCWQVRNGTKVPFIAGTDRRASHSDPETWRYYATACQALARHPDRYAGVGRVITEGDPYVGVDLDDVRDPATRQLSSRALEFLRKLDSYAEVSPSGEGVKVWIRADLPRSYRKPGLEVYRARRYFTTTGAFLPQFSAAVEERQAEIAQLVANEFPDSTRPSKPGQYHGPPVELDPYLEFVEVLGEVPDGLGCKFAIRCPWIDQHSGADPTGTYVGVRENGGAWFFCWHSHCASRGWREFRGALSKRAKKLRLIRKGVYS